jgi:hypothetical protein
MTRNQVRAFVQDSSVERIREVLNGLQALKMHRPIADEKEKRLLLDLRDHEPFFRQLADEKLQGR